MNADQTRKRRERLARLGNQAAAQTGKKAATALKRMARQAGFDVESGGKHVKVTDPATGRTVTRIPHSPHTRATIESIARAIMQAAGVDQ
ncbi:MAG TPA: type II toxin-antitoxin system HicA family toxin [Planctomycetaceae bacterium]|nr:type II toxin-antitoxin system HicA family toxin [Planctomycetaceae bacterium]